MQTKDISLKLNLVPLLPLSITFFPQTLLLSLCTSFPFLAHTIFTLSFDFRFGLFVVEIYFTKLDLHVCGSLFVFHSTEIWQTLGKLENGIHLQANIYKLSIHN